MLVNDNENGNEYEYETDMDKNAFENFIQGLHNIDTAMNAMIDNYTDGVEHLSEQNGLQQNGQQQQQNATDKDKPMADKSIHHNNK